MSRIAAILLILLPSLLMTIPAQDFPVTAVDPPVTDFPGGRGKDQLIVYTPAGGRETTGTNGWGIEAEVRDGVVTQVSGNDRRIPADGFIVSGHGKAAAWIEQHLKPATTVIHEGGMISIDHGDEARRRSLEFRLTQAREELLGADADLDALQRGVELIEREAWRTMVQRMSAPEGEVRAVWHRLTETTPEEIERLADDLQAAGVNVLLPETIYGSQAIYTDPTGLYPKFQKFGEHDALQLLIDACHRRGIEVHAWVHCFFIGMRGNEVEPALLADSHPQWLAQTRTGLQASPLEPGYMFLNPAHAEARAAITHAYVELARNYAIDGFQFDYIRYCSSESWQDGWDYSVYTRGKAESDLGFDPMDITPDTHPEEWQRWLKWREDNITSFVREVSAAVREVKPGLVLSADIFPGLASAVEVKGQNWSRWAHDGTVTTLFPMAYRHSLEALQGDLRDMQAHVPAPFPLVIGLGPYMGLGTRQLMQQIDASRQAGADGIALFSWDTTTPEMRKALGMGPWRNKTKPNWSPREN